jgi:hypothetical protein
VRVIFTPDGIYLRMSRWLFNWFASPMFVPWQHVREIHQLSSPSAGIMLRLSDFAEEMSVQLPEGAAAEIAKHRPREM